MLRFLKGFFGKPTPPDVTPKPEPVAPYKVEAPIVEEAKAAPLVVDGHGDVHEAKPAKKAPAKKRTFVKREDGDAKAKVAKIKAPAKPKSPRKPKATK